MQVDQWIYTTSCWNRSLTSGWGTFSCSVGLTQEEIAGLERCCRIPQSLPEAYFPLFIAFELGNGRKVIAQSSYIGQSFYDSRPGAAITHAFILEKGGEWPVPPVHYMGSPTFWRDLPDGIKKKALELRANNLNRTEPPPALPTLETADIRPNPDYSPQAIQTKLESRDFAMGVSRIITELHYLREEQYPLTFCCEEAEYGSYLAAMSYLLPWQFQNSAIASFYSTSGGVSEYNFLRLTGSTDSPMVDLRVPEQVEIHPLVPAARKDLQKWLQFSRCFCSMGKNDIAGATAAFNVIHGDTPVTDESLRTAAGFVFPKGDMNTCLQLGAAVLRSGKLQISGACLLEFAQTFLGISEKILQECRASGAAALRDAIHMLLGHIASYLVQGEMDDAECARVLAPNTAVCTLWLRASHLEPLLASTRSKDAVMRIMRLSQMLAGEDDLAWADSTMLQGIVEDLAADSSTWSQFISPCTDIRTGCALWRLQHRLAAEYDRETAKAMSAWLSRFPKEAAFQVRKTMLAANAVASVATECMEWIGEGDSVGNLFSIRFLLDARPELIPGMAKKALPGSGPLELEAGIGLLSLLKNVKDLETATLIAETITGRFPHRECPSAKLIAFAQDAQTRLKRAGVGERLWHRLDFFSMLRVIPDIEKSELPDFLEHTYLPFFRADGPMGLDRDYRADIEPWFLQLVLAEATTPEIHSCILSPMWGWGADTLCSAYAAHLKTYTARKGKVTAHPRVRAVLLALVGMEDKSLFRKMVEKNVPQLFPRARQKDFAELRSELRLVPGSRQDRNWKDIETFAASHRKGWLGCILSYLFK